MILGLRKAPFRILRTDNKPFDDLKITNVHHDNGVIEPYKIAEQIMQIKAVRHRIRWKDLKFRLRKYMIYRGARVSVGLPYQMKSDDGP